MTYGEAHRQVAAIGAWLAARGVTRGDRVAIAMRNYPEWLLIYWACVCMGVAVVGMNAWWVAEEIDYAIKDSTPKVIFCDGERFARLTERAETAAGIPMVATRIESLPDGVIPWSEVLAHGGGLPEAAGRQALICEPGDVAGLAKLLEQAAGMSEAEYAERAQRTREELATELEPMEFYARAYRRILQGEPVEGV